MRILLVDGSLPVRQSMKKLLAELDAAQIVGEAGTAPEALVLIEKSKPEVVILDIALKIGSGFEVLKIAKDRAEAPMVIALTNCVASPFRQKAQEEGADFFFDKATEFERMVTVLKQLRAEGKAGNVAE